MSDKVVELKQPKGKQRKVDDRVFEIVHTYKCMHNRFLVYREKAKIVCRDCKEELDPLWAVLKLASEETSFHRAHERYKDEMKRIDERSKTTCEHCKKMTRISRS